MTFVFNRTTEEPKTMLARIVKKELLLNLVSFRFQVSIILLFLLIVGSMQIMVTNYGRRSADYSTGIEMHNDDLARMDSRPQFEAFGITRDPKPTVLGIFAMGLEREMSRSFMIPGYASHERGQMSGTVPASRLQGIQLEASKYSNPIFTLFQPPDFIYVVNIVLSLLAVLFAFDTISGEKETHTLKLILTNAVPRDTVLIGKWIGGTLSIMMPFVVSFLLGIILVVIRPNVSLAGDAGVRVLLLLAVSCLYVGVFFLLGMVCSVFAERSSTSLIIALFAWIFFVLVVPNISPIIARQVVPIKTTDQIIREEERIERDIREEWSNLDEEERKEMAGSMGDRVEERVRLLEDSYFRRLARQTRAAVNISRVSPSPNFIYASANIATTGIHDYEKLRDQIVRYKTQMRDARKDFLLPDNSRSIPGLYIKIDTEKVPVFRQEKMDVTSSINNSLVDIALLILFLVLFFMIAFVKFLRYNVT
ncbi:MAG: ABC transporter permease subunit [bacterium]